MRSSIQKFFVMEHLLLGSFQENQKKVFAYIENIGYNPASVAFVPISGWHGDYMLEPSDRHSWYNGEAIERKEGKDDRKTLLEALDAIQPPSCPTENPFVFPFR
jgi:elongation factor 1-alpha